MPIITIKINGTSDTIPLSKISIYLLHCFLSYVKHQCIIFRNFMLTLFIKKNKTVKSKIYNNVVVLNMQALGDTTIGLDAFRLLQFWANELPQRQVVFVVKEFMKKWVESRIKGAKVIGVKNTLRERDVSEKIKMFNPDVLIDLDSSASKSGFEIQRIVSFKKRFGFKSKGKLFWYDEGLYWDDVFGKLPVQAPTKVGSLYIELARLFTQIEEVPKKLIQCTVKKKQIVIHPGASHPSHVWSHYKTLIVELAGWYMGRIILTGQSCDKNVQEIHNALSLKNDVVDYVPTNELLELSELIDGSELLICNNSGPLHVAVELGVKTLSIVGPSHEIWYPVYLRKNDTLHYVLRSDMSCVGCETATRCLYNVICLKGIEPHSVSFLVQRIIYNGE